MSALYHLVEAAYSVGQFTLWRQPRRWSLLTSHSFAHGAVGFGAVPFDRAFEALRRATSPASSAMESSDACAYVHMGVAHGAPASLGKLSERYVEQYVHTGVGHILAPEKFAQRFAAAPQANRPGICRMRPMRRVCRRRSFGREGECAYGALEGSARTSSYRPSSISLARCALRIIAGGTWLFSRWKLSLTVQVCRHYRHIVGAVLQVERFAHLHTGDFGDGVWLVGIPRRR